MNKACSVEETNFYYLPECVKMKKVYLMGAMYAQHLLFYTDKIEDKAELNALIDWIAKEIANI